MLCLGAFDLPMSPVDAILFEDEDTSSGLHFSNLSRMHAVPHIVQGGSVFHSESEIVAYNTVYLQLFFIEAILFGEHKWHTPFKEAHQLRGVHCCFTRHTLWFLHVASSSLLFFFSSFR